MTQTALQDDESAARLASLGGRVRALRARRGMSRRILAQASGVSERYLAQLESGKGNASVLVLHAVAAAMDVPVEDLLDPLADERPPEYALLRDRLRLATSAELRRALAALEGEVPSSATQAAHVALIGLRGAGKSTLGAALAKRLGLPFVELVQEIEREAGMAVSELLENGGQAGYRRLERVALEATLGRFDRAVIAVGGSLVSEPGTYERLLGACVTIWISAAPETHMKRVMEQGDFRPMADHRDAMQDLKRILDERHALYDRADARVDTTDLSVEQSVDALLDIAPVADLTRHPTG